MPYTQEQYQRAKSAVSSGGIPPDKVAVVQQRIAEFEASPPPRPGMGNLRAMEGSGGPLEVKTAQQPTLGEVDASFGPGFLSTSKSPTAEAITSTMAPDALNARRQAWEKTKDVTRNPAARTASKLKVFDAPNEYAPPKPLAGPLGVPLSGPKVERDYFEPTPAEFREVIATNPALKDRLQEQYVDDDVTALTDDALADSDAYRVYSDAKWQHELGEAMKKGTPIVRVMFSDKTGEIDPATGQRKLNLTGIAAHGMDNVKALGSGALQGATGGLYDLSLSMGGDTNRRRAQVAEMTGDTIEPLQKDLGKDIRDAGREARERSPGVALGGEVGGAFTPGGLPSRLVTGIGKGLSKLVKPGSLPGRVAAGAGVGAATTVLDENIRAASQLAAEALDADKSAREAVMSIYGGLSVNPVTAGVGAVGGGVADLLGAGLGAGSRAMREGDSLRVPLKDLERTGGQVNWRLTPKLTDESLALRNKAEARGATPAGQVADEIKQPLARQRLLEQEDMDRSIDLATNRAQARLEGAESTFDVTNQILALEEGIPRSPMTKGIKLKLREFARDIGRSKNMDAEKLDGYIDIVNDEAGYAAQRGEPKKYWDDVGKYLRDYRDKFKFSDEATVITDPPDKGLFTADPDVTIAEPGAKQVGAVRDRYGNTKAVGDYSAEKLRQSRILEQHQQANQRMGLPAKLEAEAGLSDPYVSKGILDPKSPQQVAENLPVKVKLSHDDDKAFAAAIRDTSKKTNFRSREELEGLASRSELESLGGRAGLDISEKLRVVGELEAAGDLKNALRGVMDGISNRGNFGMDLLKRLGFRSIPTLESLAGGLPKRGLQVDSDAALARFKRFLSKGKPDPKLGKDPTDKSFDRIPDGEGFLPEEKAPPRDRGPEFIPTAKSLNLRGGKPTRVVGAARDEEKPKEGEFSPEEKQFWLKVIDQIVESQKPQKVAGK